MPATIVPLPTAIQGVPRPSSLPNRNSAYVPASHIMADIVALADQTIKTVAASPAHAREKNAGFIGLALTNCLLELANCLSEENIKIRYPYFKQGGAQ